MTFRIGFTRDFLKPDGSIGIGDIGLDLLDGKPGVEWEFLAENTRILRADQLRDYDALAMLGPRLTADSLDGVDRLTVVARYGVGYDTVDVPACTAHGIALTITPGGVRRPLATSVIALLLALSHRLVEQDRATRAGEGWTRKLDLMGHGLQGRTLGLIGIGNVGGEVAKLAAPFGLRIIAADPYATAERAAAIDATLVDLDVLLAEADYVVVLCALTDETRGMIDAGKLAKMKPTASLINTARGPIVDQAALTDALANRKIRSAGLDVFAQEPVDANDPLFKLDNVIVTPHALCWTDEWARLTGQSALGGVLDVAAGRPPGDVVNKEVLTMPRFTEKLARYAKERS